MDRLMALLNFVRRSAGILPGWYAHLEELEDKLNHAIVLEPREVPEDVITMNSKVRLTDLDSGEELTCKLTFPASASLNENRISVLARIGVRLLGKRVGDTVKFDSPDRTRTLRVESILYQPEAAEDYGG